jgi:exodeoxyribonuclease VII large subunit
MEHSLHACASTLSALDARLHTLSPLAVLDRGYALVLNTKGRVVRSTAQLTPGDTVATRLSDGTFTSRVESISSTRESSK